jgi:hypothetical protein
MPDLFSGYLIDVRKFDNTNISLHKSELINLFRKQISDPSSSQASIQDKLQPAGCQQYKKGI